MTDAIARARALLARTAADNPALAAQITRRADAQRHRSRVARARYLLRQLTFAKGAQA